jgi:hypothetical protein
VTHSNFCPGNISYNVYILSDNYRLALHATTLPRVWAAGSVGYVNAINEPTKSGNRQLSDKIVTLHFSKVVKLTYRLCHVRIRLNWPLNVFPRTLTLGCLNMPVFKHHTIGMWSGGLSPHILELSTPLERPTSRSGPLTPENPPSPAYRTDSIATYAFGTDHWASRIVRRQKSGIQLHFSVVDPQTSLQYSMSGTKIQYIPPLNTTERGNTPYRTTHMQFRAHFKLNLLHHTEKCSKHTDEAITQNIVHFNM